MNCPNCGYAFSRVVDSRNICNGKKRRRECVGCGERYNCIEVSEAEYRKMKDAILIIKKTMEDIV